VAGTAREARPLPFSDERPSGNVLLKAIFFVLFVSFVVHVFEFWVF
jgi:hypothetical protein